VESGKKGGGGGALPLSQSHSDLNLINR
jgi:hypothetical protein